MHIIKVISCNVGYNITQFDLNYKLSLQIRGRIREAERAWRIIPFIEFANILRQTVNLCVRKISARNRQTHTHAHAHAHSWNARRCSHRSTACSGKEKARAHRRIVLPRLLVRGRFNMGAITTGINQRPSERGAARNQ